MNFQMMSIVMGTPACPAQCPFCVSGEKPDTTNMTLPDMNWRNLDIALRLADRHAVDTIMLTSRGESTLFPQQITETLKHILKYSFPFIELQTNGIVIQRNKDKYRPFLQKWYDLGLTTIAISVVSDEYEINRANYTPNGSYMDLPNLIAFLHELKFTVRLACICCHGLTDSSSKLKQFIDFARDHDVEQITIRPVNAEYRRQSAHDWIEKHKLTEDDRKDMLDFITENGTSLMEIGSIGTVYDIEGQNVMFSLPLDRDTRNKSINEIRNLIFFPTGRIAYEWEKKGAILL